MKKILSSFIFFFISNSAIAANGCIWEAFKKNDHLPKYDLALSAAKIWVNENRVKENDKCIVEFDISDIEEGYSVFLVFLIEDKNGDRWGTPGDHTWLNINKNGKVYNVVGGA